MGSLLKVARAQDAQLLRLKVHSLSTGPAVFPLRGGRKGSDWLSSPWSQFWVFLEGTFVVLHLKQCCEGALHIGCSLY